MDRRRRLIVSAGLIAASLGFSGVLLAQQTAAPDSAAAPATAAATATAAAPSAAAASPPVAAIQTATPRGTPAASKTAARADAKAGKPSDRLELDTTDITGNRELPKVMYIVPWKRSDLGDITGKPLNSLVDEVLQPVDRDVFRRENRYYGAVAGADGASGAPEAASASAAAHSPEHGPGTDQASGARDER